VRGAVPAELLCAVTHVAQTRSTERNVSLLAEIQAEIQAYMEEPPALRFLGHLSLHTRGFKESVSLKCAPGTGGHPIRRMRYEPPMNQVLAADALCLFSGVRY
jgi:hypothetical protein